MKIKFAILLLLIFPFVVIAQSEQLPLPGSGVTVIPLSQMDMPETYKKEVTVKQEQQKIKGYYEINSVYPKQLLSMQQKGLAQVKESKGNNDPQDTRMKGNLSQIKLAFNFNGIPSLSSSDLIGFAAVGMWVNDKGWTGVREFFHQKNLGTCVFSIYEMKISKRAVQISKESARYDVNAKPNTIDIEGNKYSGFTYKINWFTNDFDKELECANMDFDAGMSKKLIDYARSMERDN